MIKQIDDSPFTKTRLKNLYKDYEIIFILEDDPHSRSEKEAFVEYLENCGGIVFTGIHSERNWGETRWWSKGWHLVNRTGEYAVAIKK